ncbi:MAG: IS256 family transposase, partial [Bacillota bacterium]
QAALRLIGAILQEQQDEWLVERRYFSMKSMEKLYEGERLAEMTLELTNG